MTSVILARALKAPSRGVVSAVLLEPGAEALAGAGQVGRRARARGRPERARGRPVESDSGVPLEPSPPARRARQRGPLPVPSRRRARVSRARLRHIPCCWQRGRSPRGMGAPRLSILRATRGHDHELRPRLEEHARAAAGWISTTEASIIAKPEERAADDSAVACALPRSGLVRGRPFAWVPRIDVNPAPAARAASRFNPSPAPPLAGARGGDSHCATWRLSRAWSGVCTEAPSCTPPSTSRAMRSSAQ
jgi:hypothetical protein